MKLRKKIELEVSKKAVLLGLVVGGIIATVTMRRFK